MLFGCRNFVWFASAIEARYYRFLLRTVYCCNYWSFHYISMLCRWHIDLQNLCFWKTKWPRVQRSLPTSADLLACVGCTISEIRTHDARQLKHRPLILKFLKQCIIVSSIFVPLDRCFMSVVLQSLLHNPMMRDFFLSDMHNRKSCASRGFGA